MKNLCFLLCAGLFLVACGGGKGSGGILSQSEIVPIVHQLMMVDEMSAELKVKDSTLKIDSLRHRKYDQVFYLNEVDYEKFKKSYEYYLARPDQLKTIFDSVDALSNRTRIQRMTPSSQPAVKPVKKEKGDAKKPELKPQ